MNIFNEPSFEQMAEQNSILRQIASKMGVTDSIGSWRDVQAVIRRGQAERYFKVGDRFRSLLDDKIIAWNIINVDPLEPSIIIQTNDCLMGAQFSNYQALYYAAQALSPGTKIFTFNSIKYKFTTTKEVPVGGIVYISTWGAETYVPSKITTYAANRTTVIESDLAVTTATGTDNLTALNHYQRCRYGSNNYVESAIRQWLNSNADEWIWTPKTNYDMPSTYGDNKGFLKRLDPELVDVIAETELKVARNTVTDGGGQDTFTDKIFLLSRVEAGFGTEGTTTGETVMQFYDGITNAGRIKLLGNSPRSWWLRSPYPSSSGYTRYVDTDGALSNHGAYYAHGLSPACKIK